MSIYSGEIPFGVWCVLLLFLAMFGVVYLMIKKDGKSPSNSFKNKTGNNTNNGIIGNNNTINYNNITLPDKHNLKIEDDTSKSISNDVENKPATKRLEFVIDAESRCKISRFDVIEALRVSKRKTDIEAYLNMYIQNDGLIVVTVKWQDVSRFSAEFSKVFYNKFNVKIIRIGSDNVL